MPLKFFRLTIASAAFILLLLAFFCSEQSLPVVSRIILSVQLVPAIFQFSQDPFSLLGMGFIFVVILSFIFGRVYCSMLCPLGILQDISRFVATRFKKKKTYQRQKPSSFLRYSILALTLISCAGGIKSLLNFLDPFSIFVRFFSHTFKQAVLLINNQFISGLEFFDVYVFFPKKLLFASEATLTLTIISAAVILLISILSGRLYCNSICPVGTILSLISRKSLFQFEFSSKECRQCGKCETVCKAGCIDVKKKKINVSDCVACFNCIAQCRHNALNYHLKLSPIEWQQYSPVRRDFLAKSIIFSVFSACLPLMKTSYLSADFQPGNKNAPVLPPGALNISHFTHMCTGCHLCVSICRTQAIDPAFLAHSFSHIFQPALNFNKGQCDYECNACSHICPTGAIVPLSLDEKKQTRIGKAFLIEKRCIVYTKNKNCGACGESCPTYSIFSVRKGKTLYPKIREDYCIGCGACEKVCPTFPKSIVVTGLPVHGKALIYASGDTKTQAGADQKEDFPF